MLSCCHQSARDTLASFLTIKHSVPSHSLHALRNQEAVGFSIHLSKSSSFQHYLGCVHFYLPSLSADKVLPIHGNPASGLILRASEARRETGSGNIYSNVDGQDTLQAYYAQERVHKRTVFNSYNNILKFQLNTNHFFLQCEDSGLRTMLKTTQAVNCPKWCNKRGFAISGDV